MPSPFRRAAASLLAAVLAVSPLPALRALSLAPRAVEFTQDGVPMTRIVFEDGAQRLNYSLPDDWKITGGDTLATLRPDRPGSEAGMARVDGKQTPFDKAGLDAYARALLTGVPPDSINVAEVSRAAEPLSIRDAPSYEFVCVYSYFGRTFRRSLIVLNHPRYQLRFTLTAPAEDFEALRRTWNASLFRLDWENVSKPR